jgi:cytidine deaminase
VLQLATSTAPCGYCRQILAEAFFTQEGLAGGHTLELFIRPNPSPISLSDLLPMAFGPRDLGVSASLFVTGHHPLVLTEPEPALQENHKSVWAQLIRMALDCATRSHAPYSHSPAGVALLTRTADTSETCSLPPTTAAHSSGSSGGGRAAKGDDVEDGEGEIVGGSYYENCAFNPSISPMKAALVAAVCARRSLASISHAVLLEVQGTAVSHAHDVRAAVAALAPDAQVRVVLARLEGS